MFAIIIKIEIKSMNSLFILKESKMDVISIFLLKEKKGTQIILDSKLDFTQNILEILKTSKLLSIKPYNNKTVNRLCLSRVNALKWILD